MEQAVELLYHKDILKEFLARYHLDSEHTLLGDFENYVYEVMREDQSFILRVTHSSHRSEEEIIGELEWVTFLQHNGANVPTVYFSSKGNWIEKQVAEDNSVFYACLFSKVKGKSVRSRDELFQDKLFASWGRETGKIHRITNRYLPTNGMRKHWHEDDLFRVELYVPDEPLVIERTKEIRTQLKELPQEDYGLIHNDVHNGNFFYDGKEIHIFDFDDACYFWHVSDIAIPLYYSCTSLFPNEGDQEEKSRFANKFITSFMEGYMDEMSPPKDWMELLSLFLKVRDVTLYAALNKKIAPENRNVKILRWMDQIKHRIEQCISIVTINQ
ncbi:phosphotransferase [Ornithinibacillus sp. BX22]|uniref:Phosphotransferase n=2 Tax=Ornithinibacillus TaxID=484508 RepID=A0A923L529_9BACI|nr:MULTISPECIES: phosphotransferase [Ornithinibacillus]MBC5636581.1 phosphotransferase [Ornithinibacillus hominis]MBS3680577.1 phosphotransferase [Ornithinibacillus massiliensis]